MSKINLVKEYFKLYEKYVEEYGERIVLFMQIGTFHEAFSIPNKGYQNLPELSPILNCQVTSTDKKKSKGIASMAYPNLLGFPSVSKWKNIKALIENGFTVVIIDQVTKINSEEGVIREVTGIYSPGTYMEEYLSTDANNIVSIYYEEEQQLNSKKLLCIGLSCTDVTTGKSHVYEIYSKKEDDKYALDEAVRFINIFSPKEVLIYTKEQDKKKIEQVISYLELENRSYLLKNDVDKLYFKLAYHNEYLNKIFKIKSLDISTPIEELNLVKLPYATISYVLLLNYIEKHSSKIIEKLKRPEVFFFRKHLILGNNAVYQLNILENTMLEYSSKNKKVRCLFDVVNKTSTAMGKRYLKELLLKPLANTEEDIKELNTNYDSIEYLINDNKYEKIEELLNSVVDLERLHRKLNLKTLNPSEFVQLNKSYMCIKEIFKIIKEDKVITLPKKDLLNCFNEFIDDYTDKFNMDIMLKYNLHDIEESIFKKGLYEEIDTLQETIDENQIFMDKVCDVFSDLIKDKVKKIREDDKLIKLNYTATEGYFLAMTKLRYEALKKEFKDPINITKKIQINPKDIKHKEYKNNVKVFFKELENKSDNLLDLRQQLSKLIIEKYVKKLEKYSKKYNDSLDNITKFIAQLDYFKSGAKVAKLYNYFRPVIKSKADKSYIKCTGLRHPIVERLNDESEYIPHDITLGCDNLDGMLLYSLNCGGKSTLMKAVGLSIILAQCGMFVPAKTFEYNPYESLFVRITGYDNILKGLSSFALEMTELKAILKRSTKDTLVIGDEICRGTEQLSGNAIVAASILRLANIECSFIFASHLHEVPKLEKIKALKTVKFYHLSVDIKNNMLIFNRELKEGPGSPEYGIVVAKYILDDNEFIDDANKLAYDIKNVKIKESRYNKNVIMAQCYFCKKESNLETHHINQQKDCKDGFVKDKPHIAKNGKYNLIVLCDKCHDKVHNDTLKIDGYIMTSEGKQVYTNDNIIDINDIDIFNKVKTLTEIPTLSTNDIIGYMNRTYNVLLSEKEILNMLNKSKKSIIEILK